MTRHVAAGATVLDFGCGTGIDAQRYAHLGYRVLAYDNSPGMIAQTQRRCQAEIGAGQITAWTEEYPAFLEHFRPNPAPSAMVADFAVLNSIGDLAPLFDLLARVLAPPGWVIVSLLNPLHWAKLRTPRWWLKHLAVRRGPPVFSAEPYTTYMHFLAPLLGAAARFHLVGSANCGKFVRYRSAVGSREIEWKGDARSLGQRLQRLAWRTPAYRMLGHFVFLVLRRDA